jgi:hypothetical protein
VRGGLRIGGDPGPEVPMRRRHVLTELLPLAAGLALLLTLAAPPPATADWFDMPDVDMPDMPDVMPDWWTERFEMHGFLTTKLYWRSPGLNLPKEVAMSSWRTELNLEMEFDVYQGDDIRIGLYSVVRPTYEAIYDLNPRRWGSNARGGDFGTAPAFPDNNPIARDSGAGHRFPGRGTGIWGEYYLTNSDTGQLFSTSYSDCAAAAFGGGGATGPVVGCTNNEGQVPSLTIDDIVFFGRVTAPWLPISRTQEKIGGNATGVTYRDYLNSPWRPAAAFGLLLPAVGGNVAVASDLTNVATAGLAASLAMSSMPLATPLNWYSKGGRGDRSSINSGFADINRREWNLKYDCLDNAHPWCFVREFYMEFEWERTFVRLGRQQIVWGKTDAFRLQDIINPIDVGYHNVFPDLEERRIPQLSLDVIQAFGDIGPFQDVSLEFAWVFDRFIGTQFGQCGEPYAFTASCEARADAGGHSLFNFSAARVDEVHWKFKNTEPGLRLEFRIPEPSIAFSFSAFWGHQDLPVAYSGNPASFDNPNCASMLFLQGVFGGFIDGGGGTPWATGFDCYDRDPVTGVPNAGGSLDVARQVLAGTWTALMTAVPPAGGGCAGLVDRAFNDCAGALAALTLPFSASEVTLRYPRVLTLGFSADYQVPGIDTIVRLEMAADLDRKINNTAKRDWVDESSVFAMAIGLDRPTYIPFLNKNRTAFLSFQTFLEHVVDYDDGIGRGDGMVVPETQVITTLFMQNYWRNDSLILTSFAAYDWQGDAFIMGPSFRWVVNSSFFIDVGVNFLLGDQGDEHNLTDLCADHTLSCIADVTTWNPGNWQVLNSFRRTAQAPWWNKQSFADKIMEDRDEIWIGFTYQF